MTELSNIDRRRIQGEVIKPIYDELLAEIGAERARALLSRAITRSAEAEAKRAAAAEPDGETSMARFTGMFRRVYLDRGLEGGLETTLHSEGADHLDFDVTRCRFVEMYRDLGLGDIADVLSCNRDGTFAEAYDPRIHLDRAQTIAQGAPCCTFRYRWSE
ncbi:L-2-amino-thiazoline-4-carboxylic acid hydrolase [Rhodospira trueperi]|uniref:L-2-amino-thiazoline-4-carboxylic acid hydrolase n=1 Tax=Rhodospira trueperi TaxID=69960 RepID=A0A1G6ZEX9_9PROT|nr:L-2-amino-thiazoline-4-carboxylic acid hydrolase [Rhodospira trueperi]SDE01184.1 L-2-amino-thiazoline-4-carboxylic acid hydrolase [Rhodospira trueperi]